MNQCDICEEVGCKDCINCRLGNPCLDCENYDRKKGICKSDGRCADMRGEQNDN